MIKWEREREICLCGLERNSFTCLTHRWENLRNGEERTMVRSLQKCPSAPNISAPFINSPASIFKFWKRSDNTHERQEETEELSEDRENKLEPTFEVFVLHRTGHFNLWLKGTRELLSPQINEKSQRVCLSFDAGAEEQITPHPIF